MKESEIREKAECLLCGKPFGHTGLPFFYTIKIERHGDDAAAVQRQSGLAMLLGSPALAAVMGADEEMSEVIRSAEATVCETCSTRQTCVALLSELQRNREINHERSK